VTRDPYRYFRIEAQELLEGLSRGLLELEQGADPEVVRRLLRHAHTFKGASRVVKQIEISDLSHRLEDLLLPHRDAQGQVARETIDQALRLLDEMRGHMARLGAPSAAPAAGALPKPAVVESLRSLRIDLESIDRLQGNLLEAGAATARLGHDLALLDEARSQARELGQALRDGAGGGAFDALQPRADELSKVLDTARRLVAAHVDQAASELQTLQEAAAELRLVPAQVLVNDLELAVRDAARSLGREARFQATGVETRIDANVLLGLRTALLHVVRNGVAHGIEDAGTRVAAGKTAAGNVDLSIDRRGHRVAFVCRDDGRGMDLEAIRRVVLERGLVSASAALALDESQLMAALLRGGVSTSREVTDISGRGVGLDVVRETIERLKGEMAIRTRPGQGTTVELLVPLSLSSMPALGLEIEGMTMMIPLDSVRQTMRLEPHEITQTGEGPRIVADGGVVPFVSLRRALRWQESPGTTPATQSAVLIESRGRRAAVGVDRVHGIRRVLVRSLPEHADVEPVVAGATLDEEGVAQLVLAPAALIDAAGQPASGEARIEAAAPPPVLIIDDSLTTRMMEQSILESAGYAVDLAVSGEEGLRKARSRRYGLFLVDVEMPGIDGFEFIARAGADPELRRIPSILVTSRAHPDDRRRGMEVGARAYIVKSEFDQRQFLDAIRRLVGGPRS
jgi:two-component system, chemotaxis family, sensor kinase CheA